MKEYRKRLDEIKEMITLSQELSEKAGSITPEPDAYERILGLYDDSKKTRKKAEKKLFKLASDLGFEITKNVKRDGDFMEVWYSISRRVDRAMEILYAFDEYEFNIKNA